MEPAAARRLLGVARDAGPVEVRAAYRAALRRTHPDLAGPGGDAGRATAEVVEAYRVLVAAPPGAPVPPPAAPGAGTAVAVDGDTVVADLPAGDLYPLLVEVAEHLGDLTHVEPESGLLGFLVDLPGRGACSVLLTLQGRGLGTTEAWCTVEPLRGGPAPPVEEVAALLAQGMRAVIAPNR